MNKLSSSTFGTSRNYDDDGNENIRKEIGLMSKTTALEFIIISKGSDSVLALIIVFFCK